MEAAQPTGVTPDVRDPPAGEVLGVAVPGGTLVVQLTSPEARA